MNGSAHLEPVARAGSGAWALLGTSRGFVRQYLCASICAPSCCNLRGEIGSKSPKQVYLLPGSLAVVQRALEGISMLSFKVWCLSIGGHVTRLLRCRPAPEGLQAAHCGAVHWRRRPSFVHLSPLGRCQIRLVSEDDHTGPLSRRSAHAWPCFVCIIVTDTTYFRCSATHFSHPTAVAGNRFFGAPRLDVSP